MGFIGKLTGKKKTATKAAADPTSRKKNDYRGVKVNPNSENCCAAVREASAKAFLSKDAPMLPLNDCDAAECQCTYELIDDRRMDLRRTADVSFDIAGQYCQENQRSNTSTGRRRND